MDAPGRSTISANLGPGPGPGPGPRRAARLPVIDPGRCTGCGWCVPTCAPRLLSLEVVQWKKTSVLHEAERCTGCALCAVKCPFGAIEMRRVHVGG